MDDNSLGIVEEEEAAAASASFHDVADDMSTYDESTNTLKAVLKRRLSLNVPKSLLEGEEGEGVNTSASSPTGDNVSPLSGLNRTSIRRSARSRVYRTGSVGARSTVLSRRGAHRRFTSSMSEQLANGDRTDGDSPPNSSEPAPTDTGYPITTHGGSSSTPSPIPIMEPQARLNYMQDKEFTVLDRPFPLESHSIRPDEPNPPKRSMDTMSIDERRRPALSDSLRFNVRSTRSSDNLQAAFRKDATMTRPHTISEVRDENASDVATTLEEKRTTTKKSSAWSWLWGGDSQVEAETARMRKRHTATPTIDTSGFTAAASDSGSEGRPSIELGQPNIEMALNGAGKDATEKKKKTGMTSFFFSTSRSKHKNGSNRSANDDTPSSNASSTTATPTTPTPADGSSGNNNNDNNSHLATDTIYRLSHVKLSNPRRALVEQVLISNMMFWYLSLISQQSGMSSTSESPNEQRAAREAAAVKSRVAKGAGGRKKKSGGKRKQPAAPLLGQEFTAPIAHNNNYHSSASTSASEDDGDDEDDVPLAQIRHNPPIPAS
ncbi:hypothetical protein BDF22DRAFT_702752 [Syncephalis plumigaleata]|nr:hypothetical protein BDF22DRAFT_702752 [Syncephalis plumigaleata]